MRLASYNVENLFQRARALSQATIEENNEVLQQYTELNALFNKQQYSAADKNAIVDLMVALGIDRADDGGEFVILRQNKGKLVKRPNAGGIEVVASGRSDWVGWLDLKVDDVNDVAVQNTARVIRDVNADVLAIIEAESRPALLRFSDTVIPAVNGTKYDHMMLIDGNDERGIDVGIMLKKKFDIVRMLSHVDDTDSKGRIFSRDCPEYVIQTEKGNTICVLVNHFKSKGFGAQSDSNAKRERQATRVRQIYEGLVAAGLPHVAVVGDLNDTPNGAPLAPLLQQTNLVDVVTHPQFDDGGRPGTFGNGSASQKLDYILLSPSLFAAMQGGQIFRMGVWGGVNGDLFPHFPEITKPGEAASDHAALFADIDI